MVLASLIRRFWLAFLLLMCFGIAGPVTAQGDALFPDDPNVISVEEIDRAIGYLVDYLYEQQAEDGGWYGQYHAGPDADEHHNNWGPTSIALLALIHAGESPDSPNVERGLELLRTSDVTGIYPLALSTHLWSMLASGDDVYTLLLNRDADRLYRSWYGLSQFNYPVADPGENFNGRDARRTDNSTTQFGVIALWEVMYRRTARLQVPNVFWQNVALNFYGQQHDNGGWSYNGNESTSQAMTMAGLTCLYMSQQQLYRGRTEPDQRISEAIERGHAFIEENYDPAANVHGGHGYLWYSTQRVALLSGRNEIAGQDYYQQIAQMILNRVERPGGLNVHSAAFYIMFLVNGRSPVWINKLEVPGSECVNRPNDLYYLSRHLAETHDTYLRWEIVGVDSEPTDWVTSPVLWLSSNDAIEFTDEQVENIRLYLQRGGMLIANAERQGDEQAFRESIVALAEQMYPELSFEQLPPEHPVCSYTHEVEATRPIDAVQGLSNDERVLIVMPMSDWGREYQVDPRPNPERDPAWGYITNIYNMVRDAGRIAQGYTPPEAEDDSDSESDGEGQGDASDLFGDSE